MNYQEFLESKIAIVEQYGHDIEDSDIHPLLKPHQRAITQWCVRGGRRAIFANFGLGKTLMQLEAVRLLLTKSKTGRNGLIVCPLGVRQEFKADARKIGLDIRFIRSDGEIRRDAGPLIYLTNYESIREGKIDPRGFEVVSLDEAAILRGFGGTKTFRELMRMFEGSSTFRFVATATPSPNEYIELLSYAAFLGIMEVSEAKTRFFKRDATRADHLTLHPHKEKEFWLWCASWAIFLQAPSQLGFSDEGYVLPPLDVRWHEIPSDHSSAGTERDGQGRLLANTAISVQNAAREKRYSLPGRISKLMEIRAEDPVAHRIIWHDLEDERKAIENAIPGCASVYGSQDLDDREKVISEFSEGRISELAAKPVMLGSGCNFQRHCSQAVFLGIGFKFADFIQSIHRIQRFQQPNRVRIDLIYTEAEREVRKQLERKWEQHRILVAAMGKIITEYGLATEAMARSLQRSIGIERREEHGRGWVLVNNDCVLETARMEADSVALVLTSIPFSTQYEYSPSYNDFGHNENNDAFFEQMDFLTPELFRVLQPGRICAIHVKDRIMPTGLSGMGFQTVNPFHSDCIEHYRKHGFGYLGMKTIVTDVVRENNQTYRLGWSEQCKDGTKMGCGMPEYLLLFRKPATDRTDGYADVPVVKNKPLCDDHGHPETFNKRTNWKQPIPATGYSRARWQFDAHGFTRSSGDRLLSSEELRTLPHEKLFKLWRDRSTDRVYDFADHIAVAEELDHEQRLPATFMLLPPHSWHPDVWTDITRMRTLNGAQSAHGKEMHLCPMQFDLVERAIGQFTMKDELVYDPFAGLGTVPMMAIKMGRRGLGCELSAPYFADSAWYLKQAESQVSVPTLFDLAIEEETLA
jgi:DNA modification methylase